MLSAIAEPRVCCMCPKEFWPRSSLHRVCSQRCATKLATSLDKARKVDRAETKKKLKAEKEKDRATRERLKKPNVLKSEAQDSFNQFIRYRDRGLPCVSCGVENPPMTTGGQWDAGHFLSRGSHPELAFDEDNCHKQCKKCNGGGGKFRHKDRTVTAKYEDELLRRIGPERLAKLRGPHPPAKRKADDYRAIKLDFRARRKELEKQRQE